MEKQVWCKYFLKQYGGSIIDWQKEGYRCVSAEEYNKSMERPWSVLPYIWFFFFVLIAVLLIVHFMFWLLKRFLEEIDEK